MHILYYHQHFSTPEGATGTRSYEMAQRSIARGHEVTMVCGSYKDGHTGLNGKFSNGRREGQVHGIHVIELSLPYSNYDSFFQRSLTFLHFALKSVGIALTRQYDLLFATSTPLTAGIPGIFAKLLRRKSFVFEVRDLWPELPKAMGVIRNPIILHLLGMLEWISYHAADACIGLSPGIVRGIARRGIDADRIAMIPNACDLELFGTDENASAAAATPVLSEFCVAFSGAHGIANGLDAVLDAARVLLQRSRDDIQLVFIGDGKRKPHLQQRAAREGLSNCLFLDPVPKRHLAQLLKHRIHVGLMILDNVPAFYYGTSPNKFFDYITAGLPVLNNYPGWLAELITEHHCGLAVPPNDPVAFADALEFLKDHPDELNIMGQNARLLAERQFDRKILADRFVDCLEKTVKR